uniref:Eukaryotic translation initiation factor 3 subunit K n=1 Tax=Camelus bactrianus TaxID=9837 RepID=A0A9W3GI41_CAMBA|nr:eukaryotic translation initiation factor 3 subunit K isoform X1 [Camelus bactrianus]
MAMFEQMRANVGKLLKGIDRYNPENLATLERYVETQAKENAYDLEANLAVLKLYQFNPAFFQTTVTAQILLKALTNLPHTDFTLCKCMIDQAHQEERPIRQILYLGDLLETCHFQAFWQALDENMDLLEGIAGFEDSVRKFICHVVGITYQHIDRWLLAEMLGDLTDTVRGPGDAALNNTEWLRFVLVAVAPQIMNEDEVLAIERTQDLMHAKLALYHLSYTLPPWIILPFKVGFFVGCYLFIFSGS